VMHINLLMSFKLKNYKIFLICYLIFFKEFNINHFQTLVIAAASASPEGSKSYICSMVLKILYRFIESSYLPGLIISPIKRVGIWLSLELPSSSSNVRIKRLL